MLREAVDRQDDKLKAPTQRFSDMEELHGKCYTTQYKGKQRLTSSEEFQLRKRTEFEKYVRINRINMNNWLRYAQCKEYICEILMEHKLTANEGETEQKEFRRARSVFERCLAIDPTQPVVWLRYIDAELLNKSTAHARNLCDRANILLPRIDKLWLKHVWLLEMLGDISGTREVFSRWTAWEPSEDAFLAFGRFETRYQEIDRASQVYERMCMVHPEGKNWLRWAKWSEQHQTSDLARDVYVTAVETLGDDFMDEKLFIEFGKFECRLKEFERAEAIYKFALDRLPRSKSVQLHKEYVKFSKQYSNRLGIENVVLSKRRVHYSEQIKENPKNYDAWIAWAQAEESAEDHDRVLEVYEKAVANIPPTEQKRHWRRYIYLWLFYASWSERTGDSDRARQIYQECLRLIPHKRFTFSKVWISFAKFLIRKGHLAAARKLFGKAVGICPKDKLFKEYIGLEMKLYCFDRCRVLFEKYIEFNSSNCQTWIDFANLERGLEDVSRARALFEIAVREPEMDMPELLWKAYIDFEESELDFDSARNLYKRLLEKTNHVKVWTSWAQFELSVPDDNEPVPEDDSEDRPVSDAAKSRARKVFVQAHSKLKEHGATTDRVALLTAWRSFESIHGSAEDQEKIEKQMPRKVKKRRKLDDGEFEEYVDFVFPADDESAAKMAGLLAKAQKWKEEKARRDMEEAEANGGEQE